MGSGSSLDPDENRESAVTPEPPIWVYCPRCQEATDQLKRYNLAVLYFVPPHCFSQDKIIIACADCVRWEILWRSLLSMFWANLASPVLALHYLVLVTRSYARGHNAPSDVLHAWPVEAQPTFAEPRQPRRTVWAPFLYVVVLAPIVLAGVAVACFFFLLPEQMQDFLLGEMRKHFK
jgi:hypothetical protein